MRKFYAAFGLLVVSVAAVTVLTTHKAAAATYCFMLGDPSNGSTANNACLSGQTSPPELYGLSGGMSSSALASTFINDINNYAGKPYPVDRVGAAYVKAVLQQRGGNWATNIQETTLTVEGIPAAAGCANTAYDPSSNSVVHISDCTSGTALVARQNGSIVFAIKLECGNVVGNFPGPQPNRPPTGSFVSLVCNVAAETYTITVRFSDPDAATNAQLRNSANNRTFASASGTSATWTISTKTLLPGDFPVGLWVKDTGPGGTQAYNRVATHAIANCQIQGNIGVSSCTAVTIHQWDPNNPNGGTTYYLSANGGSHAGPLSYGPQSSGPATVSVTGVPGFDYWKANQITLYGYDAQSNAQVNLGTVTLPICGHVSCGGTTLPANLVAGEPITFQVWVSITGAPNGPPGARFTSIRIDTVNTSSGYSQSGSNLYSAQIPYTPQTAGMYGLSWTFGGGESNPPSVSCSASPSQVAYEPYFTVAGGDVSAGQGFGGSCTPNTTAGIAGENLDTGSGVPNYFGASSRQGALAAGTISHFATDTTNNLATNVGGSTSGLSVLQPPKGLAFANTSAPAGTYGGGFLAGSPGLKWCVPDYAATAGSPGGPFSPGGGIVTTSGTYTLASSTIGNLVVQPGVHVTLVATGDVYINGNITYAPYATLADIPQFTLITKGGNIYIDSGVTELHGFYAAQPSGGSKGVIYTCATGLNTPSTNYGQCNNPLTMYGAVSANIIVPGRMLGNVAKTTSISDNPAEQFVYSPELWLGTASGPSTSCAADPTQTQCEYQSYTSLPPVL